MDLGSALSIASSGLNGIEYQYSVVSQNVANSSTTGYASESASVTSAVAGNQGTGVRIGKTVVNVSPFLQSSLYTQNAKVSALTSSSNSLAAVESVQAPPPPHRAIPRPCRTSWAMCRAPSPP